MSVGSPNLLDTPTYGIELEKVFSGIDGEPHLVGDSYFETIRNLNLARGQSASLKSAGDRLVGVGTEHGVESLDISFGLGESATGPIEHKIGGLNMLNQVVITQLRDVLEALEPDGATVINMANHPLTMIDNQTYDRHVAPKPVYEYMRDIRGWDHKQGINAKAQNSPSVGVSAERAVDALNITLGLGAGLVAMYANSPFDQGELAGVKESRLHIWDDVFKNSTYTGDRRLHRMPDVPFANFREYFQWMFASDTAMYFVVVDDAGLPPKSEKDGNVHFIQIDEQPTLLEFFDKESWSATTFDKTRKLKVVPEIAHLVMHQFAHFAGARIRFSIEEGLSVGEFNAAMAGSNKEVDELFARHGNGIYIEGREPGANFPDQQLVEIAGEDVSKSLIMSAAAIHTGLIRNADRSLELIESYGWNNLIGLREEAIKDGVAAVYNGLSVSDLCFDMLAISADGLDTNEQWLLEYPDYVLSTKKTGSDRALERYEQLSGSPRDRIAQIVRERRIVLPPA